MSGKKKQVRAIALFSGGLDSILAVKVIQDQDIEVTALTFASPFFSPKTALKAAERIGVPVQVKDVTGPHMEIIKNPRYGYGKAMNPCIDCHGFMFRLAGRMMREEGYDFIFSGEVLGERPMSQNKGSLHVVAKLSEVRDRLVRPLSAKLLEMTAPEKEGLVDRERLLDISGRGRKRQLAMAAEYGITEFPTPAGGCLLTDKGFGNRLRDLLQHVPDPAEHELHRLKTGRHFRFNDLGKVVVGRNKYENDLLVKYRTAGEILVFSPTIPGPYVIVCGPDPEASLPYTLELCGAYGDHAAGAEAEFTVKRGDDEETVTSTVDKKKRYPENRI